MIPPFEVQLRFVDIDMLGHVNNAVYFSYLEMT
jgi:acyl-CoA thioesterase FadM